MTDSAHEQAGRRAAPETTVLPAIPNREDRGQRHSPGGKAKVSAAVRTRRVIELKPDFGSQCLYYLMFGVLHLLSLLPDFVLYPFGVLGGLVGYWLDRRHVKIGLKNLELAFPEYSADKRRQILRASYVNLGRGAAEYIRLGGFFYRRLKCRVSYERFELWDEIARRHPGKGFLILTAHFGNFELLGAAHALHGHQISLVHHTQRFLAGDAFICAIRQRVGVETIRKHAAARAVLKALRANQLVGIPFDQNAKRSEAVFVPFLGDLAATSSGLARLVQISGAAVVPVFIVRQPDNRTHRIVIQDEIPIQRSSDPSADIEENTRRFVKPIEEIARRYPEQFLWTHRRFRTRPRGAPKIYDS